MMQERVHYSKLIDNGWNTSQPYLRDVHGKQMSEPNGHKL